MIVYIPFTSRQTELCAFILKNWFEDMGLDPERSMMPQLPTEPLPLDTVRRPERDTSGVSAPERRPQETGAGSMRTIGDTIRLFGNPGQTELGDANIDDIVADICLVVTTAVAAECQLTEHIELGDRILARLGIAPSGGIVTARD